MRVAPTTSIVVIVAGASVLAGVAAQDANVQKVPLDVHIQQVTGALQPLDCGSFQMGVHRAYELSAALECAHKAAKDHRPFKVVRETFGEDSRIMFGVIGGSHGRTLWFDYDSAPCGGAQCAERFETKPCAVDKVVVDEADTGVPRFRCSS